MKKFVIAALAVSVLATTTPVMAAPGHDRGRYEHMGHRHVEVHREVVTKVVRVPARRHVEYRAWHRGDRFDHRYAPRYVVIKDPHRYRLHDAPRGYHWVRSGNDAVLVGITSGIVAAVVTSVLIN